MNKNFKVQAQGGFTLIELIVVIVILGILAATALPKFADLSGDARAAKLQAAKASLNSVIAMTHGQYLVNPSRTSVTLEGSALNLVNGYPKSETALATALGLDAADYTTAVVPAATGTTAATYTIVPSGVSSANTANCTLTYKEATSSGTPATITPPTITLPTSINCN